MLRELMKSIAGVLIMLPTMVLTAFSQIFMMPFAQGIKICFGFFISTMKGRRSKDVYLNRRVNEGYASTEEFRTYAERIEDRHEKLRFLFNAASCTRDEAEEYLVHEMTYNKEENPNLTREGIDNFLECRFGSGKEETVCQPS